MHDILCFLNVVLKAGIPCKLSPEAWIKDLAGTKPLTVLAKKVCVMHLHGFFTINRWGVYETE